MHELVDENLKKGNRSDQKLNFREVIDSIYEWNLKILDCLDSINTVKNTVWKGPYSMIWNTRAYEQLLFGFCWYREELRLPNCAIPVVIEHEFKGGYFHNKAQAPKKGIMYTSPVPGTAMIPWDSLFLIATFKFLIILLNISWSFVHGGEKWFQRLWSGFYGCQLNQVEIQDEWMQQYFNCQIQPRIEATGCRSFRVKHGFRFSGISTWMECDIWQGKVSPFRVIGLKLRDPLIMGISLRRRR